MSRVILVRSARITENAAMAYQFPPKLDELVKQQLATGNYQSEDEVLFDALHLLRRQREELAAIHEGIDDMENGRVTSLREFDREFRERKDIPQDA